jgi:thioredoxin reductase (NADPH)
MPEAKPAVIVVDDDPEVLHAVARDLRRQYGEDYRIVRAASGPEALDAIRELKRREDPVALLLSDQRMPGMDGVRFLVEAGAEVPSARRALLTAYADTDAAIAAINDSRVDYYLLKPWDPPEEKLYPVLDDLLHTWRAGYRPGYGGLRIVGDRWSAESHRLRDFLARNGVPYTFLDVEANDEARDLAGFGGDGLPRDPLPLVLLPGGERLGNPAPSDLARYIGLHTEAGAEFYDLAIVGGGPAGLASAVYGASEGLKTVLVEREATGGQAGTSSRIENYLGFPAGLTGGDLARRATAQAQRFGVEILTPREVTTLEVEGPYKHLRFDDGRTVSCHALMLAMGVDWRRLDAEGADGLTGRGVYYGAAMTEALSCRGEHIFIVGAGNSAGQAALHFAGYADRVTMLVRGGSLALSMSQYLVDRIAAHERIEVCLHHEVTACHGTDRLEAIRVQDRQNGAARRLDTHYVFVFIGAAPRTEWLGDQIARDARGFVLTGPDLADEHLRHWPLEREPFLLETCVPGVFAAGDVRHQSVKRVASAVGEGSVAVAFIHQHLAHL